MMIATTKHFVKACWPLATRCAFKESSNHHHFSNQSIIPKLLTCQIICKQSISSIQQEFSSNFRALEPKGTLNDKANKRFDFRNTFSRNFFWRRDDDSPKKRKKRIPKLILVQNPLTWLMIKIDFSVLRHLWDPSFEEKEFKFGTKQAIARVTEVISKGQFHELNGLLTKPARQSLIRELDRKWSHKQRVLLALNRDDIQISSPRKVYFIRIAVSFFTDAMSLSLNSYRGGMEWKRQFRLMTREFAGMFEYSNKKFCDVDMAFLALKWTPINNNIDALLFAEIFARFHREYTPHCIPEWTIAYFKVTRFEVLRRQ